MADGVFVSGFGFAETVEPAEDLMYIIQPDNSPKSRKILVQTLMAGPTAEARKASYYIYTVDSGSGSVLILSMETGQHMSVRFSGSAAFTTVQVPDGAYVGQIVAITNDRAVNLAVEAVTPSTLHKTITLGNGDSCTLTWEGGGSWRADSQVTALELAAEAATRSAFDAQFATAISTADDCIALGPGPSGVDIVDTTNSQVRVSRQGPKAWLIQGFSLFGGAVPIETNVAMEWFFGIPAMDTPGVFQDLYNALLGATYFPCATRSWEFSGATFQDVVSVRTGVGPASAKGLFVKAGSFNWAYTAVSADVISQLSLRMSGMVILP